MKNKVEKKESKVNVPGLIIALVLVVLLGIGIIFLTRWFFANSNKTDDTTEVDEGEVSTNRLLKLLNDNITKTRLENEALANEVTTFSYIDQHFYIGGSNGTTVYQYDVDLSSKTFANTKEALDFLKENDVEGQYDITLNRYINSDSNEFTSRYVTDGVSGKYHIGQLGPNKYVFATLLKDEQITVINGDLLSDTLEVTYSPTTISSGDALYSVYKYIATL